MEEPTTLMSQLRLSMDKPDDNTTEKDPREMTLKESMAPLLPPSPPPPPAEDAASHTLRTQLKRKNDPDPNAERHLEEPNHTDSGSENNDYDQDALHEWQDTAYGENESTIATAAMEAEALRKIQTICEEQEFEKIDEELMNSVFIGNFSMDKAREYEKEHRQNLLNFESGIQALQETNNQLTEELSEANEKMEKLNEELQSDIKKLKEMRLMDQLQYEKDLRDTQQELEMHKREKTDNSRIVTELCITKDELLKSNTEIINLKANLMQMTKEKSRLDRETTELEDELRNCQSELHKQKTVNKMIPGLKQKIARLECEIKAKALGAYQIGERIKRTTSITSLAGGRRLLMMSADDGNPENNDTEDEDDSVNRRHDRRRTGTSAGDDDITRDERRHRHRLDIDPENQRVCVPDERGEKMIKNYRWPKSSSVEFETWRRLMLDNISSAQRNGISDRIINNNLEQYLLTQDNLINEYARLKQTISTATLEGTKELITNLNVDESIYGPEERFRQVKLRKGESATKYLGRLECQFRELYGNRAAGEERRIKQQFVEGFIQDGHQLDPDDKRFCEVYANLTDMAIYAEKCMAKKLARLSNMRNNYTRKNINFVDTEGAPGMNGRYYFPINMMDQAQPDPQPQQAPPPPPPPPQPQPPQPQPQTHYPFPPPPPLPPRSAPNLYMSRQQPTFRRPQNPRPKRTYVTAEPGANRVTLREWENNVADDGSLFCHRCLIRGHMAKQCQYFTACAKCSEPPLETGHSTKFHEEYVQNPQQNGQQRNYNQQYNNFQNNQGNHL